MTPRDAQMYWISRRMPTDQYLLYCFDEPDIANEPLRRLLIQRARGIPELNVRVAPVVANLDYPYWVPAPATMADISFPVARYSWQRFTSALEALLPAALDAQTRPWRLHLYRGITGAPGGSGPATVAVLRIAHALADGQGSARIARQLFGVAAPASDCLQVARKLQPPSAPPAAVRGALGIARWPGQFVRTAVRGQHAAAVQRAQPGGGPAGQPLTVLNSSPGMRRSARLIVLPRNELQIPGYTVTVSVLAAISAALPEYLTAVGHPPGQLGAEITAAMPARNSRVRNNFRNIDLGLPCTEKDPERRAASIAEALGARSANRSPLARAQAAVAAVLPASILAADIASFPLDEIPTALGGNTVVSSVNRGSADLLLGGGAVRFTAGFPALSPFMGLTHGVHGLGDTVTVSVHSSPAVMPELSQYAALLSAALSSAAG